MKQLSTTILRKITLKHAAIALLSCSALGLAACQTHSSNPQGNNHEHHAGPHHQDMKPTDRNGMLPRHRHHQMSQAWREQMRNACLNKTNGENIRVKIDDKTLSGQCQLAFQPERNSMQAAATHQHRAGSSHRGAWNKIDRQAFQQACIGKSANQKTTIQLNEQTIDGSCQLRFKRTAPNA